MVRFLPKSIRAWIARPPREQTPLRVRLPWWGLGMHSQDKQALAALIESARRLTALVNHPGWTDVESVIQDWIDRYTEQARRLGQRMEDQEGRLILREEDTPADDRRRLIACAQASALIGLLAEIHQRAKSEMLIRKSQQAREKVLASGELI